MKAGPPSVLAPAVVQRIHADRAAGKGLRQIAYDLNASGTPTAHGGAQWWPSTVRAVLCRAASAQAQPDHRRTLFVAMAHTRTRELGPAARPVAVPDDLDDPAWPKASGRVELPLHIRWSGPSVIYDLTDRADRARVYEQVLREGTEDDVRYYVDPDQLRELFGELVLPPSVRRAWADWLRRRRRGA